jgi:hypothetical protein
VFCFVFIDLFENFIHLDVINDHMFLFVGVMGKSLSCVVV